MVSGDGSPATPSGGVGWSVAILFFLIFILVIFLLIIGVVEYQRYRAANNSGTPTALPNCDDYINKSNLLALTSDNSRSCAGTSSFYVPSLDFVVAPYPSTAQNTCLQYCDSLSGSPPVCVSASNPNAQSDYNNCLTTLINPNCAGPLPLAISGQILYYAISPTDRTCPP